MYSSVDILHAIKASRSGGIPPLILNLGTRMRWMVKLTPRLI